MSEKTGKELQIQRMTAHISTMYDEAYSSGLKTGERFACVFKDKRIKELEIALLAAADDFLDEGDWTSLLKIKVADKYRAIAENK